jgi:hypothetical protein
MTFNDGASGLVDQIKRALWTQQCYPDVTDAVPDYHTLLLENDAPQSHNYADYYRYDVEVRLIGEKSLP